MFYFLCFIYLFHYFTGVVKDKGIDNVTVDNLIDEVTPKARGIAHYRNLFPFSSKAARVQICR